MFALASLELAQINAALDLETLLYVLCSLINSCLASNWPNASSSTGPV